MRPINIEYMRRQAHLYTLKAEQARIAAADLLDLLADQIQSKNPSHNISKVVARRMVIASKDPQRLAYIDDNQFYTRLSQMWSCLLSAEIAYQNWCKDPKDDDL
jgi:hypothetical protein